MAMPAEDDQRSWTATEYELLKRATKHVIRACGGLEAASMVTRVGHSELARYYDPREKLHMPIDVVADLERDAGTPTITRALANLQGYELVSASTTEAVLEDQHHWPALLATLGKETAATLECMAGALAEHGTLSSDAIREYRLAEHVNELIRSAIQLKSAMLQKEQRAEKYRQSRRPLAAAPAGEQ